jgi:hypothetical protein
LHAEELGVWLDQIIDSDVGLNEYVDLMKRRKDEGLNVEVLRSIVEWYVTSKKKVSPFISLFSSHTYIVQFSYVGRR